MIRPRALQATLGLLLAPLAAQACPQPSLSCIPRYHFALDQQTGAGIAVTRGNGLVTTRIGFGAGVDFFPVDNLSVGLQGGFAGLGETPEGIPGYAGPFPTQHDTEWRFAWNLGARVGYNVPLSRRWSVWPRVGLGLDNTPRLSTFVGADTPYGYGNGGPPTLLIYRTVTIDLHAPVVVHPNRYFFVGFGPFLALPVYAHASTVQNPLTDTTFGFKLLLGGHF